MTKEELEKEAEEKGVKYADNLKPSIGKFDGEEGYSWSQVEEGYENGFKDGAEFGYNKGYHDAEEHYMNVIDSQHKLVEESKANEWHYVKDGKYPTHSYRVLVFTDEGVGFGIYGHDNKKWYTYDTGFDVIAWKEIVLPELPKESK